VLYVNEYTLEQLICYLFAYLTYYTKCVTQNVEWGTM